MTKSHIIVACSAIALIGSVGYFAFDQSSNETVFPTQPSSVRTAPSFTPSSGSRYQSDSKVNARIASLEAELLSAKAKLKAAEQDVAFIRDATPGLEDQVIVAFGKVEEIGRDVGNSFNECLALIELEKKGEIDTPENKLRFARFRREVSEIQGVANQIFQFENDPKEGGEFFSSTYQTIFDLDASTAKSLNSIFSEQIAVAKERGLTLVNSPSYKVRAGEGESLTESEEKAWYTQREDFFSEVRTQLRDQFPIEKQEDFDRLVEEGDIGFNVLKVKGMNLSLSFRGSH